MRQREKIPFREIAKTAFQRYPRRAILGLALFIGQAFLYNGVTFNLGMLYTTFFGVSSSFVPVFLIVFAVGNFLGPLLLGRLFDTVGRKPMIAGTLPRLGRCGGPPGRCCSRAMRSAARRGPSRRSSSAPSSSPPPARAPPT